MAPVDGEQDRVTFPTWRTSGDVAPVDGDEDMAQAAKVADGAASVEVAADGNPANNQSPEQMAGQVTMSVWHLLTQRDRRCQSDSGPNKMNRLRRRKLHRLVRRKLHVRGRGGCVRGRGRTACEDVAVMTLTEHGRTMLRETQFQSFNAIISSSKRRRRTFCAKQ